MDSIHTAHVLVFQDNKVLLVIHGDKAGHITGTCGIAGGHLDSNESMKQAAVREFEEETGLKVKEEDLQPFSRNEYTAEIPRKDGSVKRYTMHVFLAEQFSGNLKSDNETTPEWIDLDKLDKINLLPNVKEAILAAQEYLQEGYTNEG